MTLRLDAPLFPSDIIVHNREVFLSQKRAAQFAGCDGGTIATRIKDGSLKSYKLPRHTRIKLVKQTDLEQLIESGTLRHKTFENVRAWTATELDLIRDTNISNGEAAFRLDRSYHSIASKRHVLGIKTPRQLVAA